MNYLKSLGFGALIWGVAFVVVSAFISFGIDTAGLVVQTITTFLVLLTAFLLAKSLNLSDKTEMLKYSFSWVVVGLILDVLITTGFTGWEFFYDWSIWVSYVLILLVPLLAVKPAEIMVRPEQKTVEPEEKIEQEGSEESEINQETY